MRLGGLVQAQHLLTRGQHLAARGLPAAAVTAYERALTLAPRTSGLQLHYALALADLDRLPEALGAMQRALERQPDNPVLHMFLGQIYCDHAVYEQAAACCARALQLSPDNIHALGLQALVTLRRGDIHAAYTQLTQPCPQRLSGAERLFLWLGRSRLPGLLQQANSALQSRLLLSIESVLLQKKVEVQTLSQQLLELPEEVAAAGLVNRLLGWVDHLCMRGVMGLRRLSTALRHLGHPAARAAQLRVLQAEQAMYLGQLALAEALYAPHAMPAPAPLFILERLCELCYLQGKFPEALRYLRAMRQQAQAGASLTAVQAAFLGELLYQVGEFRAAESALQRAADEALCDYKLFYYLGVCQLRRGARLEARSAFASAVQQLHPDIVRLRLDELYRCSTHLANLSTQGGGGAG